MQPFEYCCAVSACQLSRSQRAQISKHRTEIITTPVEGNDNHQDRQHLSTTAHTHHTVAMSNPLDTDAGSELFSSYEAELKLVQADLNQKLDLIPDLSGEPRKAAISQAERALEEANELVGSISMVLGDDIDGLCSSIKCALRSRTSPLQPVQK